MRNLSIGIYPGSFDPLTNGHLDIIRRAARICDSLYVAVARNSAKKPLFSIDERLEILRECCPETGTIEIVSFDGLLADFCVRNGISIIVRGLRATADYEYEHAIALMNRKLAPELETIFLMAASEYSFVSSKIVKEVASNGGDVSSLVPPPVVSRLKQKFSR
jgi:pantetheine-phosphate adenylyltransferase